MYLWKTLKIFLSSTFLDLELERDRLAEAFYSLKKELIPRQLSLIPYDLRWRERASDEPIPKWCIEMLQQCQYFVGILGWRYGWRPDISAHNLPNTENISVTEMEVRTALTCIPKKNRFFCMIIENEQTKKLANNETLEDRVSIAALKQHLRENGETILEYANLHELPELIITELRKRINEEYSPHITVAFEQHTHSQALEEIIQQKVRGFIGRTFYLEKLEEFSAISNNSKNYLAIVAVAGTGKSALLAKYIYEFRQKHQDLPLIAHFMSMGSDSRQLHGLFLHLAEQLQKIGILGSILEIDPVALRFQVKQALEKTNQPLILAIDGLDEIEEEGQNLSWLSKNLPSHVKLIATIRPVGNWEILQTFPQLEVLDLPPLAKEEIYEIIQYYVQHHKLNLSESDCQILVKRSAGNPLYLKVALEEILSSGIAVGQLANSIESLFEQILQRLQKRYGQKMIEDYLGLIAASRAGLAELELQELLSQNQFNDVMKNLADEARITTTKALDNFLVRRAGLITFFHPEFERSIKERLGKNGMKSYHKVLAQYFHIKGYGYTRSLFELCYQQQCSLQHKEVALTLTDFDFLQAKCSALMGHDILEDFQRALYDVEVRIPENFEILHPLGVTITRKMLFLLAKSLRLDMAFLRQHPQSLFQSLWNRLYWYDAPIAENYYEVMEEGEIPPWKANGPKLYKLVEAWREKVATGKLWLRSCKPLEVSLDTPMIKVLREHEGWVTSVMMSSDGRWIVSGAHDQTIRIWDAETGDCCKVLQGHREKITKLFFLNQSKNIVSTSEDGEIRLWQVEPPKCLAIIHGHQKNIDALAVNARETMLATGAKDWMIHLWKIGENFQSLEKVGELKGHQNEISALAFDPILPRIVSGSADLSMRVWDIVTQTCVHTIHHHKRRIYGISFSPDGSKFASASRDDTATVWENRSYSALYTIHKHKWGVLAIDFSPDGKKLITASGDKSLCLWDAENGQCLKTFRGHERSVSAVRFSQNGKFFVSGSYDRSVRLWNAESQECSLVLKGHDEWVRTAVFSPNGKWIASGSTDRQICIWDGSTGLLVKKLSGHTGWVTALAFSPDNTLLASGGGDNSLRLWNVNTSDCLKIFNDHTEPILAVSFIPELSWLVSASRDKTIKVWDIQTGECIRTLEGHTGWVTCLHYDTKTKRLISGSHDTIVRIWNVETGECVAILDQCLQKNNTDQYTLLFIGESELHIRSVAFDRIENRIIVVSRGQKTLVYDYAKHSLVEQFQFDLDAQQMADNIIYPANQELITTLMQRDTSTPLAFFSELIAFPKISPNRTITGVSQGNYVYLLKVQE